MTLRCLAFTVLSLFAFAGCKNHHAPAASVVDASVVDAAAAPQPSAEAPPPVLSDFADACVVHFTGRMKADGPEYEVANQTNKKLKSCTLMGYAYDAHGKQIAISHTSGRYATHGVTFSPAPAPGETEKWGFGMEFDDPRTKAAGVSFEAIVISVELPDGTYIRGQGYPEQRPMTGRK